MTKMWEPAKLWPLPGNPYSNHTPAPDTYERIKWAIVGLTLFLPRLLLVIFTSAHRVCVGLCFSSFLQSSRATRLDKRGTVVFPRS